MLNDRTKALIRDYNPWWENRPLEVPAFRRHLFAKVEEYLKTKQIIAVVGMRRVGKTVLLRQLIKELSTGNNRNVFYFSFDDLLTQNPDVLGDVVDYYLKVVAVDGRKYVFLDEIQKVPFWQDVLKRFYDMREDVKFVVSGSASLQIRKSKESLAGRIFDFHLPVLSFQEFLEMNGVKMDVVGLDFASLEAVYDANLHRAEVFSGFLGKYVLGGAFPEVAVESDVGFVRDYVKSAVLERIVFEDIPPVFNVRRKDVLYGVLEFCCRETSNILDVSKLAQVLGASYQTVRSYLFYLQNSFIVDLAYNYSRSAAKQLRRNKKVHVAHPSLALTMAGQSGDILSVGEVVGRYVESVVFGHCRMVSDRVFFWRTPQGDEVDVVVDDGGLLPIEVKYSHSVGAGDFKCLLKFLRKYGGSRGVLVSRDVFRRTVVDGKEILIIPAWLFLLSV